MIMKIKHFINILHGGIYENKSGEITQRPVQRYIDGTAGRKEEEISETQERDGFSYPVQTQKEEEFGISDRIHQR